MPIRSIRLFPDACLTQTCHDVDLRDLELQTLIDDLMITMRHSPGVGLAAPQIGVAKRISVIEVGRAKKKGPSSDNGPVVLINPRFVEGHGVQIPREGCLSVPDLLANVRRFNTVLVETQTLDGKTKVLRADGFEALAFQHELDHLDGKLFLDRVIDLKTDLFRRKFS